MTNLGSPEWVSASVAGRGADGGANPPDLTTDAFEFHAMMDREKAQEAAEAPPPSSVPWREQTSPFPAGDPTARKRTRGRWRNHRRAKGG